MRAKKAAHAERREEENAAAEDFCPRIALLPEEIKIYTLYYLNPRLIMKLKLPVEGCSAGRRTARHQGVGQVHLDPQASYQRGQVSPLQVGSEGKPGSNLPCGQAHLLVAQLRLPCLLMVCSTRRLGCNLFCSSKQLCWF